MPGGADGGYIRPVEYVNMVQKAQTAHLPIEEDELVVDAVAVRPGRGKLYVTVHDMYDADKVGTAPGIEIRVRG